MLFAKIAMWTGAVTALFATDIPSTIFYYLGIRPFPDAEFNHFTFTFGLCILTGGVVAYTYERDDNSN